MADDDECIHGMNPAWCANCKGLKSPDEEEDDEIYGFFQKRNRLPLHRTEATYPIGSCSTCDGGGCLDCTDPA